MPETGLHVLKGLTPSRKLGAGVNNVGFNHYPITNSYAFNIGEGDPVLLCGGKVKLATNTATKVLGVFLGVSYVRDTGQAQFQKNFVAGTSANGVIPIFGKYLQPMAMVADDPEQTYIIRTSDSTAIPQTGLGKSYKVSAIGTVVNGRSQAVIDVAASAGTSGGYMVNVLGISADVNSAWGVAPNAVEVKLARQGTIGGF